jgi:hypothetical protein
MKYLISHRGVRNALVARPTCHGNRSDFACEAVVSDHQSDVPVETE